MSSYEGGLCHHVVALLLELAEYSLSQLKEVPDELACTIKLRAWVVPGQTAVAKEPVMVINVNSQYKKKRTTCTLYDSWTKDRRTKIKTRGSFSGKQTQDRIRSLLQK